MEKISAACAMEWSIELEKSLRSKNPSKPIEAIQKLGPRLVKWSKDPDPTMGVYTMFGLIQGEDRVFANSILLRLADAFKFGDRRIRRAVVRMFLFHRRMGFDRKGKREYGVLSKARVVNREELLSRVKFVVDCGEVEDRALGLVLFGCWADFANISASVRYVVLSGMVASDDLEVKASLFAAGCFCELADDFASTVLEILVNVMTSSEKSLAVRVAGARVFANMACSYAVVNKAYKIGTNLVKDSSDEQVLIPMLLSLSKIARKSAVLISEQVDLLVSFSTSSKSLRLQETALNYLDFIFANRLCNNSINEPAVNLLFKRLDEPELPLTLKLKVLRILEKVLIYPLPNLPCDETEKFDKLFTTLDNLSNIPNIMRNSLAIQALEDMACRIKGGTETSFLTKLISLVTEQIAVLVKSLLLPCRTEHEMFQEFHRLLHILYTIVREHPDMGILVLDKINCCFLFQANEQDHAIATAQMSSPIHGVVEFSTRKTSIIKSKIMYDLYKFLVSVLEDLTVTHAITADMINKVKRLVDIIHRSNFYGCYTKTIYSLLLHSRNIWSCLSNRTCNSSSPDISFCDCSVDQETITIGCAKRLLEENDYWYAYRAGIHAACQGAWFTASFLFEQLVTKVQSNIYSLWLKSVVEFAYSERKIQLLLVKDQSSLNNWLEQNRFSTSHLKDDIREINQESARDVNLLNFGEIYNVAFCHTRTSVEILGSIISSDHTFYFQRWFMSVKAKVLGSVSDVLNTLGAMKLEQETMSSYVRPEERFMVKNLNSSSQIMMKTLHLMRCAQELDLIATTFIDMDIRSSKTISALALSCSVLAFSTKFALFVPHAIHESPTVSDNCLNSMLIQNLVSRLWHVDRETSMNLTLLLKDGVLPKKCFHLQSRNTILKGDCEVRDLLTVCRYAATKISLLQHEAKGETIMKNCSKVAKDGLQLLLDIILKWIYIPFQVPSYYFKVRPPIGSQLHALSVNGNDQDGIYVLPGHHLTLNLCLQLSNIPPNISVPKLYCILQCREAYQLTGSKTKNEDQMPVGFEEPEDAIELNEKLLWYASQCARKGNSKNDNGNDGNIVYSILSFQPNERGQCFSSCLLDVSRFSAGSYRIRWRSGCFDNKGSYWSLLPLNSGPVFTVQASSSC